MHDVFIGRRYTEYPLMDSERHLAQNGENKKERDVTDPVILINRMREGDTSAFEELAVKYAPLVRKVHSSFENAVCEVGGREAADELMQDLGMALFRSAETYDVTRADVTFGRYAKKCLGNCAISFLRKAKSAKRKQERAVTKLEDKLRSERAGHTFDSYFAEYDVNDKEKLLKDISGVLSSYEFTVFNKYLDGVGASRIADELGCDAKSVNNALFRSRRKVANLLGEKSTEKASEEK